MALCRACCMFAWAFSDGLRVLDDFRRSGTFGGGRGCSGVSWNPPVISGGVTGCGVSGLDGGSCCVFGFVLVVSLRYSKETPLILSNFTSLASVIVCRFGMYIRYTVGLEV